ncbi:cytosolic Fe-S cluster assembly factor NBP35 [Cucumis melo var. makuwa]|uniref:Cytosolic Fe-S cluster assembly factor NBP35 n=1 Tax=Cucumis melo var. makuwa TaxID=1194695 RepID=A0A5D3CXN2_CUCMM|nr:cytosolic Fe-S cluster assembly factor NBP35 [Cucumis melo var. makuwa]TYK16018.1 cytosolic Fe-S cluster assembly factor NBP35 [Cucumis melo var. makuwa]
MENSEIPENANENCPGPESESAGKSDACQGCPNQSICATAPKGPDPGALRHNGSLEPRRKAHKKAWAFL